MSSVNIQKTILLVFIHGFKGNDHTFQNFPQDLRALIAHTLPQLNVVSIVYPQYETKGDLKECVARFKEWLIDKVIDLEVEARTPSPTVDPSVRVILCGHSMGGIVAAEALLSIAADAPIPPSWSSSNSTDTTSNTTASATAGTSSPPLDPSNLFFPYIQALLTFDTPFLGLNPGIIAHNAEQSGTTAYDAYSTASKLFGRESATSSGATTPDPAVAASKGLPSPSSADTAAAVQPGAHWLRKYAIYTGAAAAIAGMAGATYYNWSHINNGLTWAGSHLQFVGCLARGAELQKRVEHVVRLSQHRGVAFANFYGALGEDVEGGKYYGGLVEGTAKSERTFCIVPRKPQVQEKIAESKRSHDEASDSQTRSQTEVDPGMQQSEQVKNFARDDRRSKGEWVKCVNPAATDEVQAHTAMFEAGKNPDYHGMLPRARDWIVEVVRGTEWYGSETEVGLGFDLGEDEDEADEQKTAEEGSAMTGVERQSDDEEEEHTQH
ncbi:unnamed protein product [Zymoseptoria tritici ST99CH_1E4]|uniref:AB hydrolase-1 domain-containing protein n=1 Tax=Zymoseptoria tritici ST99CH_1E4 TaxID=1276532 RepID=A0A2H1FX77_ZYMTR|nr:unnamed protein product [Zymoseptoria tritici ST99CH_1E4]